MNNRRIFLFKLTACIGVGTVMFFAAFFACRAIFPFKYKNLVQKYCSEYNVDVYLVLSLIKAESSFDESAESTAGAKGLMQLTPSTFSHCVKSIPLSDDADILSPKDNLRCGIWYLAFLLDKYGGDTTIATAAYNAGPATVDGWLANGTLMASDVPYGETSRHISKIKRYVRIYRFLYPTASKRR